MKTLGIEAHNLRAGGGLIYLQEFLFHLENYRGEFDKIIIWTNKHAAGDLSFISSTLQVKVPFLLKTDSIFLHFIWVLIFNLLLKKHLNVVLTLSGMNLVKKADKEITMFHSILPFSDEIINLYRDRNSYYRYRFLQRVYLRSIDNSDGLLFSSKFAAMTALRFRENRLISAKIIPFGIWTNFLSSQSKKKTDTKTIKFLYVSNFYLYKRHLLLISVFEELINSGHDISLTLCGDTFGHEDVIRQLTSMISNRDKIKYIGKIPHKYIPEIYHNHDVLIFPSLIESFGIPLIEAQYSDLWILFSFSPAEEIMKNNNYTKYRIIGDDLKDELEKFILQIQRGEVNLSEPGSNRELFSFKQTTEETIRYLESFL